VFKLEAKVTIDDYDPLGLAPRSDRPIDQQTLKWLAEKKIMYPAALCDIRMKNKENGATIDFTLRVGRFSAKAPRKLKKRFLKTTSREPFTWPRLCQSIFMKVIMEHVNHKTDEAFSVALDSLMQSEDQAFLDLAGKASKLVV
jgi:hypothetical protein